MLRIGSSFALGGIFMRKSLKNLLSAILLGAMILSITACAPKGVRSITPDQFKKAIKDAHVLAKDSEFMNFTGSDGSDVKCVSFSNDVRVRDGSYYNCVQAYLWNTGSDSDAKAMFDEVYENYVESGAFDGTVTTDFTDGYCYFTLDGTLDAFPINGYCYGGWYWAGNTFAFFYTNENNDDHRGRIDSMLDKIGFPKPGSN